MGHRKVKASADKPAQSNQVPTGSKEPVHHQPAGSGINFEVGVTPPWRTPLTEVVKTPQTPVECGTLCPPFDLRKAGTGGPFNFILLWPHNPSGTPQNGRVNLKLFGDS